MTTTRYYTRFGTENLGNGQEPIDQVEQALSVGFSHVETAQGFRNEAEAGVAIRESGLARSDIYITTKFSGLNGLDIPTSIKNSLNNLGVTYVDLYLIHHPSLAVPDMATVWKQMEELKRRGLTKSIGVCNFGVLDLKILLASAKIKPAVNQVCISGFTVPRAERLTYRPIMEFASEHGIVTEAFSILIPVSRQRGGPLDKPLREIAARLAATPDQVLLAWAKTKGAVVVTTSSKKRRLEGYLRAADLGMLFVLRMMSLKVRLSCSTTALTSEDIRDIDEAGAGSEIMDFLTSLELRLPTVVILLSTALLVMGLSRLGCAVRDIL
ncbi:hypothetical protein C0995_007112 [Termitomyces sp. Mi166|nr:hypothetical protein C0995_007112 [Termitomyces sp. Mi166\